MESNRYKTLGDLNNPSPSKMGMVEYSTNKPYQHALYGHGITVPTFVGIQNRKMCYQDLCVSQTKTKPIDESNKIFQEFDRGMLIYRDPR